MRVRYNDHITDKVIILRTGSRKLMDIVTERGFRMAGHILRLRNHCVLALDLEGVHDVKLHHPSSSVATSN